MSKELEHLMLDYYSGTNSHTIDEDGVHLYANEWVFHDFVPISPSGNVYEYDITYSCSAGNHFYIGWERFDANFTSRSNNATVYVVDTLPSTNAERVRKIGTVNLSTDGVNPCAYIRLRVLNGWSGSTSGATLNATIHSLSLLEKSSSETSTPKVLESGQVIDDHFSEKSNGIVSITKRGYVESENIYEY